MYSYTGDELVEATVKVDRCLLPASVTMINTSNPMPAGPTSVPMTPTSFVPCPSAEVTSQPQHAWTLIDVVNTGYPEANEMMQLSTPAGPTFLTRRQYQDQLTRVREAGRRMGGVYINVPDYVRQFGLVEDEHEFGRQVWQGLINLFFNYSFNHLFVGGRLVLGWFQAPYSFSKMAALDIRDERDYLYYPACFIVWPDYVEQVQMACEAILLQNCRPWWVHVTRVRNSRPVTAQELSPAQREVALKNGWVQAA